MASAQKIKNPGTSGIPHPTLKLPLKTPSSDLGSAVKGKKVVVVGGTNGLGRAIAKLFHTLGAQVTVVGRTFLDEGSGITFIKADLSSIKEAARLGRELPADIDVLLFTTGIIAASKREVTAEGLERDMAVSYLNRLALLRELAPRMSKHAAGRAPGTPRPRVLIMAYPGAGNAGDVDDLMGEKKYGSWAVHLNTVAGNESLVLDSAQRYPELAVYGINPGLVRTGIRSNLLGQGVLSCIIENLIGAFNPTPDQYAAKVLPALLSPALEEYSGQVHINAKPQAILPSQVLTPERVKAIIEKSEGFVAQALAK